MAQPSLDMSSHPVLWNAYDHELLVSLLCCALSYLIGYRVCFLTHRDLEGHFPPSIYEIISIHELVRHVGVFRHLGHNLVSWFTWYTKFVSSLKVEVLAN